jgi:hypothetical protein
MDSGGRFVRSASDPDPGGEESGHWSVSSQAAWVDAVLPLLLSKQSVSGITWAQLVDSDPPGFVSAGLFDRELKARPVVEAIRGQRFGLWPAD